MLVLGAKLESTNIQSRPEKDGRGMYKKHEGGWLPNDSDLQRARQTIHCMSVADDKCFND